jgi:flagellar biosynthesis protein FlhG
MNAQEVYRGKKEGGLRCMEDQKNILVVSGPKGGVGKTTIAANMAIAMAGMGKKVTVVDLDLGAANLHAIFGLREAEHTLDDFVFNRVKTLAEVIIPTDIDGLGLICGGNIPDIANLAYARKIKLMRHLSLLDSDMVVIDLGAGSSYNVIDFALMSDNGLIVTTSEVPSLTNTYSFIKSGIFRKLTQHFRQRKSSEMLELLEMSKDHEKNPHLKTINDLRREAEAVNAEEAATIAPLLASFRPAIAVNRIHNAAEKSTGEAVQNLMRKYLSLDCRAIYTIREDTGLRKAAAMLKPILSYDGHCAFSVDICDMVNAFLEPEEAEEVSARLDNNRMAGMH